MAVSCRDSLNGQTFFQGTAIALKQWTFTRATLDATTPLTGSAITLDFYLERAESPLLSLSIGSGLTRVTNTDTVQSGTLVVTPEQVDTLLGDNRSRKILYRWTIEAPGYEPVTGTISQGYSGFITVAVPSLGL